VVARRASGLFSSEEAQAYGTLDLTNELNPAMPGSIRWCHISDVFQTINPEHVDSYKLKELVVQFNLTGNLLS